MILLLPLVNVSVSHPLIVCVVVPSVNVNKAVPATGSTLTTFPTQSTQIGVAPAVTGLELINCFVVRPESCNTFDSITTCSLNCLAIFNKYIYKINYLFTITSIASFVVDIISTVFVVLFHTSISTSYQVILS
jgi:hypothetical protein